MSLPAAATHRLPKSFLGLMCCFPFFLGETEKFRRWLLCIFALKKYLKFNVIGLSLLLLLSKIKLDIRVVRQSLISNTLLQFRFVQKWLGILKGEWGSRKGSEQGLSRVGEAEKLPRGGQCKCWLGQLCLLAAIIKIRILPSYRDWETEALPSWKGRPYPSWWLHFKGMAFRSLRKTPLNCRSYIYISKG